MNSELHGKNEIFTVLNINIRSISKNFDKLTDCIKAINHNFTIIGVTETHLKDKPLEYFKLPGYEFEYVNRVGREKGGVGMYISNKIKYSLRNDLCCANSNFESCFIEIERTHGKNALVGVIYRAHTPIDNFSSDMVNIFDIHAPFVKKQESDIIAHFYM